MQFLEKLKTMENVRKQFYQAVTTEVVTCQNHLILII